MSNKKSVITRYSKGNKYLYLLPSVLLGVYQLFSYNLLCTITDIVHSRNPHHLVFRFEHFRYALLFGKLLYQPRKHCFCLLMGFCTVSIAKSLPCAVRIKLFAALFAHALRVLMTVIRRPAFRLGFGSMRSIALTLSSFLALSSALRSPYLSTYHSV